MKTTAFQRFFVDLLNCRLCSYKRLDVNAAI